MSSKFSISILFNALFLNHDNSIAIFKGVTFGLACSFPKHPEKIHTVPFVVHIQKCNLCFHLSGLKVYFRQEGFGAAHQPWTVVFPATPSGI